MMAKLRRFVRDFAIVALIGGVFAGIGAYTFSHVLHLRVETVTSNSMNPAFVKGSKVIVKEGQHPAVGSVVMFHNNQTHGYTTHVYLGTNPDGTIQTWGIANGDSVNGRDHFYPAPKGSDIVGTVIYHTEIFTPNYWMSLRGLGSALLLLVAIGFAFVAGWLWCQEEESKARAGAQATDLPASSPA